MVKLTAFLLMIVCISLVVGACNKPLSNVQTGSNIDRSSLKELHLEIPTITCTSCRLRVKASARSVSGVIDVRFDSKIIQKAIIIYDPAQTRPEAIIEAIERNGDKAIQRPQ